MSDPLSSVTFDLALASLDLSMARHRLIAANIANHATAGYEPQRLDFESHLAAINASAQAGAPQADVREQLRALVEGLPVEAQGGQTVQLDDEINQLLTNTLHYNAVLTGLGKLGALNKIAIDGAP
ncbi:hypothetical protein D0B54_04920 [Solimonas sp. K1W22B-7]|uniref:flagellar basal body rod protein FlgB n=1 Tax=Solimonas sp. K1W22B-7 TaxID=2303331 RepID=UPI000E3333F7|nr:hypothetical protein [Solimonas sp. K1W22B-7]AXQ28055.1 hypothetical protein D0B54_04920 [Solimonas sp. K1W22B-7]